jgi:tripartite-type tricarboxylate transporter receptor subunit TctC
MGSWRTVHLRGAWLWHRYSREGNILRFARRQFLQLAAAAAAPGIPQLASALDYPTRPITMIVPAAAGGPLDTIARILADRMRSSLGQIMIVENVAGAAGSIGVGRVARAAGDGYTLVIGMWGNPRPERSNLRASIRPAE